MIGIFSDIWLNFGDAYVKLYGKVKKVIKKGYRKRFLFIFYVVRLKI